MRIGLLRFLIVGVCMFGHWAYGQSVYVPFDQDYYYLINRYEVLGGSPMGRPGSSFRPLLRKDIALKTDTLLADTGYQWSRRDLFNLRYLNADNHEWSSDEYAGRSAMSFYGMYRKKNDFFYHKSPDLDLHISPVMHFMGGRLNNGEASPAINSRGLVLRAMVGKKVGIYSYVTDNQISTPLYVNQITDRDAILPGEGFWRKNNQQGYDFFSARAYITVPIIKQINLTFGHDKNFVGYGYRSMILSDNSNAYNFLRINTRVWKLNYTNLFTQMKHDITQIKGASARASVRYPDKYLAYHHLSAQIRPNLQIGVFEAIAFGRDSLGGGGFDIAYLNPVIFYRYAESNMGSPDNAGLGFDMRWVIKKRVELYSQIFIDEWTTKYVFANTGWWGNKRGFQFGGKYYDVLGVKNLDLQGEYNTATPFTYTSDNNSKSYTHFNMPLAHPLGANFRELIGIVRYQPAKRVSFVGKLFVQEAGLDKNGMNYGGNLLLDYKNRVGDFNNSTGQGARSTTVITSATITWMARHNLFFDLNWFERKQEVADLGIDKTTRMITFGMRFNASQRLFEY